MSGPINEIIIRLMLYFAFYSTFGWISEVVYYGVKNGHYEKRGFINGPMNPIYGVTMVMAIILLPTLVDDLPYLFLGALIIVVVIEWLTGLVLDKVLGVRLWNYKGRFLSLKGYTCAWHSLKWAFATVVAISLFQPILYGIIFVMPAWLEFIILIPFYIELVAAWVDAIADAWEAKHSKA